MKTAVIIATYNERENIAALIREILSLQVAELKIFIVDDNSPDGTAHIIADTFGDNGNIELIVRNGQRGYGSAHICGFKEAMTQGFEIIITMDADLSHSPTVIPTLITEIQAGNDVVVGSRRVPGGSVIGWNWKRKLASQSAMVIARLILGLKTRDVTSGFRAYRTSALQTLALESIQSNGYSFLEELMYRCEQNGLRIKETPITFRDRMLGKSKFSIGEILKFFVTIFRLRFHL